MKIEKVHIHDCEFARGHRWWWTADCRYFGQLVEMAQSEPMSLTRDSALDHARDFASSIRAEFVEPVQRLDPCL